MSNKIALKRYYKTHWHDFEVFLELFSEKEDYSNRTSLGRLM
ncbi:MAG: hypothetical protein ACFFCI_23805 [Promethearchaeota archaeon]